MSDPLIDIDALMRKIDELSSKIDKLQGSQTPESSGIAPGWMEKVAEAGGWEESAQQKAIEKSLELARILSDKETQKSISALAEIEKDEWKDIATTAKKLYDFIGLGGYSELALSIKSGLKEQIEGQFAQLTAPIKNAIIDVINTILEPFMPFIEDAVNNISNLLTVGMGAIEALFTGKLDEFIKDLQLKMQDEVHAFQVKLTEEFWSSELGKTKFDLLYSQNLPGRYQGMSLDELAQSALEGGVYSGQFELSPEDLEKLMNMRF